MAKNIETADTRLPNLNRRSALAALAMGIAGGATLATGASAETPVSHELTRLIERPSCGSCCSPSHYCEGG